MRHYPHLWISARGLGLSGTSTHLTRQLSGTHYRMIRPLHAHRYFPPSCFALIGFSLGIAAWRHCEIPLLSDIVLASDTAAFQDSAHFMSNMVPGDGMHIVYPLLLGFNRARYFLLTGQTIGAQEAHQLGLVAEVLPQDKVLARAWELAEDLAKRPTLLLRYTRLLFTDYLKKRLHELLGYGLAMESLALLEKPEAPA